MPIDTALLDILVCPADKRSRLVPRTSDGLAALNGRIVAGGVKTVAGRVVDRPIDAGLVRADGAHVYPVVDDIPVLLIDEAIPLG